MVHHHCYVRQTALVMYLQRLCVVADKSSGCIHVLCVQSPTQAAKGGRRSLAATAEGFNARSGFALVYLVSIPSRWTIRCDHGWHMQVEFAPQTCVFAYSIHLVVPATNWVAV
jgi:hypothetical protein